MRRLCTTWAVLLAAAGSVPAQTPPPASGQRAIWRKIWASRAAQARAASVLAGEIEKLPLAQATVGVFLDAEPARRRALLAFLLNVEPAGTQEFKPDGRCELTLTASLGEVAAALADIRVRHPGPGRYAKADFAAVGNPARKLSATVGAAPPAMLVDEIAQPLPPGDRAFRRTADATKRYWAASVAGPGRTEAEAKARADAQARLARRVGALRIDENTSLAEYVAAGAPKAVSPEQFLRAARVTAVRYHADAPLVEVSMAVSVRSVYACLRAWAIQHRRADAHSGGLEALIVAARGATLTDAGLGAPATEHLKGDVESARRTIKLARAAPEWIGRSLRETARAVGPAPASPTQPLDEQAVGKAARLALEALAGRMEKLPVSSSKTVADVVGDDARRREALLAVLLSASPATRPTVDADGTVTVSLELPLDSLWRLLLHWQRQAG